MNWLIDNWFLIVVLLAGVCCIGVFIYNFMKKPTQEQINTIKEWLLYACLEAETELGGGTGQLKLRYVWDVFITRFPAIAKLVSFELISSWVDAALEEMRKLLTENKAIREVVKGEE